MKRPDNLSCPTPLCIAATILYCLSLIFHIIAIATDSWGSLLLDGVRWHVGLWQGCQLLNNADVCTSDVFEHEVFKTGSGWLIGSRVMMCFSLVCLLLLEIPLIGYSCIKPLEKHKSRLAGFMLGFSLTSVFCHIVVVIMYGSEIVQIPGASIKESFGMVIISLLLELASTVIMYMDMRCKRCHDGNVPKMEGSGNSSTLRDSKSRNAEMIDSGNLNTVNGLHIYAGDSELPAQTTKLSEKETYNRFVDMDDLYHSIAFVEESRVNKIAYCHPTYIADGHAPIESTL